MEDTEKRELEEEEIWSKLDVSNESQIGKEDEFHDCEQDILLNAEKDEENEEFSEATEIMLDDFVDEELLKEQEKDLSKEQLDERLEEAKCLKEQGNTEFKEDSIEPSIKSYTKALQKCPLCEKELRAILYANRAAAKIKLGNKESAIMDCTKSLEYNDNYMKSLIRRAKLYEEMDKLDEALADYQKIYELDSSNMEALSSTKRLPPLINERNEKLKGEMIDKLKDLGNLVLRPFGLSTNNFQLQPTEAGGYTINFKQ